MNVYPRLDQLVLVRLIDEYPNPNRHRRLTKAEFRNLLRDRDLVVRRQGSGTVILERKEPERTGNNTVAIVMAGPIAKEIATEYGISPKRSASLLDTFSCVFQGIIPYGAQMLVAISACTTLGFTVSAFEIIPLLFYPMLLCLSSLLFILFDKK